MNRRWQFGLGAIFGVTLLVAALAWLGRLGHYDAALLLGGAIAGSLFSRRLLGSIIGAALVSMGVFSVAIGWAFYFAERRVESGAAQMGGASEFIALAILASLGIGAVIGTYVWLIREIGRLMKAGGGRSY